MRFKTSAAVLIALAAGTAAANAGANVVACVHMTWKPSEPLTVTFKPGVGSPGSNPSDQNVDPKGHEATATVYDRGLTCADVGYVKETGTFEKAIWSLGYTIGEYNGSTSTVWSGGLWYYDCWLEGHSPKTYVCPERTLCNHRSVSWDEILTHTLYFLFTPGATNSPSDSTVDEDYL